MPTASSIYWNSLDSQPSSGGSSGESNRHYVDPWDLENYVYLRRHSVAASIYQGARSCGGVYSTTSQRAQTEPDYWYSPSIREPGYDPPASVEELYFGVQKQIAHNYYYPQPIYEDSVSHYTTALSIYSPLSEVRHSEPFDVYKTNEKLRRRKKVQRSWNYRREECLYHGVFDEDYQYRETPLYSRTSRQQDKRHANAVQSRHDLNTYGYLKIDYANSWDSLHRKIGK